MYFTGQDEIIFFCDLWGIAPPKTQEQVEKWHDSFFQMMRGKIYTFIEEQGFRKRVAKFSAEDGSIMSLVREHQDSPRAQRIITAHEHLVLFYGEEDVAASMRKLEEVLIGFAGGIHMVAN